MAMVLLDLGLEIADGFLGIDFNLYADKKQNGQ